MGDINAQHPILGDPLTDNRGRMFEDVIRNSDCSILNTGTHTHFHTQTGTSHAVDVSMHLFPMSNISVGMENIR